MKAFQASNSAKTYKAAEALTQQVLVELEKNEAIDIPSVEEVQDTVERVLIENGFVRTAKTYILYRAERSRIREMNTRLMRIYDDITNKAAIDSDIKRENANINGDTAMGAMLKYGSEGAKQFNLMFILKPEHAAAHRNGDFHIHDMDFLTLTTTCCQIDLIKLFKNGFSTGHGYLREPNDIYSYSALACIAKSLLRTRNVGSPHASASCASGRVKQISRSRSSGLRFFGAARRAFFFFAALRVAMERT
jgi:ribonucleoside-triphosphate reductase